MPYFNRRIAVPSAHALTQNHDVVVAEELPTPPALPLDPNAIVVSVEGTAQVSTLWFQNILPASPSTRRPGNTTHFLETYPRERSLANTMISGVRNRMPLFAEKPPTEATIIPTIARQDYEHILAHEGIDALHLSSSRDTLTLTDIRSTLNQQLQEIETKKHRLDIVQHHIDSHRYSISKDTTNETLRNELMNFENEFKNTKAELDTYAVDKLESLSFSVNSLITDAVTEAIQSFNARLESFEEESHYEATREHAHLRKQVRQLALTLLQSEDSASRLSGTEETKGWVNPEIPENGDPALDTWATVAEALYSRLDQIETYVHTQIQKYGQPHHLNPFRQDTPFQRIVKHTIPGHWRPAIPSISFQVTTTHSQKDAEKRSLWSPC